MKQMLDEKLLDEKMSTKIMAMKSLVETNVDKQMWMK